MRVPANKRHLVVNKEYSRLPYWTDDGYDDVQKQVSQKYVQDSFGKFAESENQQSYKEHYDDAGYDNGYQGLEYQYTPFGMDNMPNINDLGKYPPANPQGLIVIICFCKTCICYDPFIAKKLDWVCTNGQHGVFDLKKESQLTFDAPSMYDAGAPSSINRCDICDDCSGDPCKSALISPTTLTMTAGTTQTLTVSSPESGTKYKWSTTTGTVSPVQGQSITFTAPETNVNCANNATVTLTATKDGVTVACDTLAVSVNVVTTNTVAYKYITVPSKGDHCVWSEYWPCDTETWAGEGCGYYYTTSCSFYNCDGTVNTCYYLGATRDNTCSASSCSKDTPTGTMCTTSCTAICGGDVGFTDMRTAAQKAAGCCPGVLI